MALTIMLFLRNDDQGMGMGMWSGDTKRATTVATFLPMLACLLACACVCKPGPIWECGMGWDVLTVWMFSELYNTIRYGIGRSGSVIRAPVVFIPRNTNVVAYIVSRTPASDSLPRVLLRSDFLGARAPVTVDALTPVCLQAQLLLTDKKVSVSHVPDTRAGERSWFLAFARTSLASEPASCRITSGARMGRLANEMPHVASCSCKMMDLDHRSGEWGLEYLYL
jgi:hypothetical protein